MRTTLNDGAVEIQRAVGEAVSLGVGLAVDVRESMPVEASHLVAHTTSQPTELSVGAPKESRTCASTRLLSPSTSSCVAPWCTTPATPQAVLYTPQFYWFHCWSGGIVNMSTPPCR
ncbi:unnamed protein product [Peronospora belbahrii]|uniref:Uncharacterized protein n=1 Tax=Peronospora belbahrii TaxID=622444 RepID=A0AAU9LCP2_9STRA|nr:unnamed protein product [Peronospora belbahrii]